MAIDRVLHLQPPLAGVDKSTAVQETPPFTCYDSLDFWPLDAKTSRQRPATRPGFESFGSLNSANMQAVLNVAPSETYKRQPMWGAAGTLYRWDGAAITSAGGSNVDTGRNVTAIPYLQKLYILNETLDYKVYNYSGHTVSTWTTGTGSLPTDYTMGCVWDGRIMLSGLATAPHQVLGLRQDDPDDSDTTADDPGAAFLSTSLEGGNISEPVTALVPHNRVCLLVGHYNGFTVYRNNPRAGGSLEQISSVNGPICKTAWCKTPDGWLYYLSRHGLYKMAPGCGTPPIKISPKRIPESLRALDGINDLAFLEYDRLFGFIHIYVTGSNAQAFHFWPESESFWPVTSPGTALSICNFDQFETSNESGVLIGTSSGLKRLDRTVALEGATAAYLKMLIRLDPNPGQKRIIDELLVQHGDNTTDTTGTLDIYGGQDAEAAIAAPIGRKFSVTTAQLSNNFSRCFPYIGGNYAFWHYTQGSQAAYTSFENCGTLHLSRAGIEG